VAINLIEPEALSGLVRRAKEKGIAVIARHPRAIGLLTTPNELGCQLEIVALGGTALQRGWRATSLS
jgi:hypothetical protein